MREGEVVAEEEEEVVEGGVAWGPIGGPLEVATAERGSRFFRLEGKSEAFGSDASDWYWEDGH